MIADNQLEAAMMSVNDKRSSVSATVTARDIPEGTYFTGRIGNFTARLYVRKTQSERGLLTPIIVGLGPNAGPFSVHTGNEVRVNEYEPVENIDFVLS